MENSLVSSILNKSVDPENTTEAPEESGWTSYFEDLLSNQRLEEQTSLSADNFGSCHNYSMVSDSSSSCAPSKFNTNNQVAFCSPMAGSPNKISFKKTRTKEISRDDSLEDTATSPVNTPKVSSLKQMDIHPRKKEDNIESSLGRFCGRGY